MSVGQPGYYAYEASCHCVDCARERFGEALDNGTATDIEGNSVGVGFDTDERDSPASCNECSEFILTSLTDTGEDFVVDAILRNRGRPEVLAQWREEFDWLEERIRNAICEAEFETVADGGDGQYDNSDYFSGVAGFVSAMTEQDLPEPDGLGDADWGHEALEEAIGDANDILREAGVDRIISWHGHLPGVLMAGSGRAWDAASDLPAVQGKAEPPPGHDGMEGP